MTKTDPLNDFDSSPKIIRLAAMKYVRLPVRSSQKRRVRMHQAIPDPKRNHTNIGMLSPVDFELTQRTVNQEGF
jgi:hypothetical protein